MRLFVALDPPPDVRQKLWEVIGRLREQCLSARWVRPEEMHITLKFIGYAEATQADLIGAALDPIRSRQPAEIQFQGLGFFPNVRRPRVVWCGMEASPNLAKLAADIEQAIEPLGFPAESREFVPHLTLTRLDPGKIGRSSIEKLVQAVHGFKTTSFGSARETAFHLYESVNKPSGAEYKRMRSFPFVKGAP